MPTFPVKKHFSKDFGESLQRIHLLQALDRVNDDHCPILTTRQNGRAAVLLSLDDFKSYEETAYLMKSPKNAERLNAAIAELEKGKGIAKEIIEE